MDKMRGERVGLRQCAGRAEGPFRERLETREEAIQEENDHRDFLSRERMMVKYREEENI